MIWKDVKPLAYAAGAVAAFAGLDAAVKLLTVNHNVLLISFVRYGLSSLAAIPIWLHGGAPRIPWTIWRAHAPRGFCLMMSGASFYVGLALLPLVEAVTLGFVASLMVAPATQVLTGERMRPINLIAALIGFIGVAIAAQGGAAEPHAARDQLTGVAAVMVSCASYACGMALTRKQALEDGPLITQITGSVIPTLLLAAPAIALSPPPRLDALPLFLLIGALGALAANWLTRAYSLAEAQRVAPFDFTAAIWAPIYGYVLFHEVARPQVLIAAPIIIGACMLVLWDQRRRPRRDAAHDAKVMEPNPAHHG